MEYKVEVEHRVYMFASYYDAMAFFYKIVNKSCRHFVFPIMAVYHFHNNEWRLIRDYY